MKEQPCFRITRTRLITEVFRVSADNENDALESLGEGDGVERLELSTLYSNIEQVEEV